MQRMNRWAGSHKKTSILAGLAILAFGIPVLYAALPNPPPATYPPAVAQGAGAAVPTAMPAATAVPVGQERKDFRAFYAQLVGAENICDNTVTVARKALNIYTSNPAGALQAYTDAKIAYSNCGIANQWIAGLQTPASLAAFTLDAGISAATSRVDAIRDEWSAVAQVLNSGSADLATQSTIQGYQQDEQHYLIVEVANLVPAEHALHINLKTIKPTPH